MGEITVTVSGPIGCGKSAIAGEIEIALKAIGVPVRFTDEREWQSEKNRTHADWAADLDMYQPNVVIAEKIEKRAECEHAFQGWRTFEDGNGGEQVCNKCGLGALAWTLREAP